MNLRNKIIRPSTTMQRLFQASDMDVPIARVENIARRESNWRDASTDKHAGLYNSCLTIGVQYRPEHAYDDGHFTSARAPDRILAGFLTLESRGNKFRSPGIEDALAHWAYRLFSVILSYSEAHYKLTGDLNSPIAWVYRELAGLSTLDLAAE
jgi:hypothetical protein